MLHVNNFYRRFWIFTKFRILPYLHELLRIKQSHCVKYKAEFDSGQAPTSEWRSLWQKLGLQVVFSYKFTFIPFLCFHRNQKQESIFQQVGRLVTEIALLIWQTYYTFGYLFLLHISRSQTSTIVPQEIPYLMPNMVFLFKSTGRTKIICCRKSSIIS